MRIQNISYGVEVHKIKNSKTYIANAEDIKDIHLFTPIILVDGIEEKPIKFEFYKVYKNKNNEIMHCEYRTLKGNYYSLVVIVKEPENINI